jgi:hypothetical protein
MMRGVVAFLALGFIVSAILAWVFDITPQGIKRTPDVSQDETVDIVRQLEARARQEFVRGYLSGLICAGLGDKTKVLHNVGHEYLIDEHLKYNNINPAGISVDAMLEELRSDPRFKSLGDKPQ